MSRERLEEIRTRLKFGLVCLKHLRREILNSDDESLKYQVNLLENDIRYLFKQAKRVHELEDKLELVMDRHTYLEGDYYSLQQQNKRYQDMLVKIFKIVQNHQIMKISDEDYADAATFIYKWIYDTGAIDPVKHFSEVRGHDEFDSHQINLLLKKHIDKESSKALEGEE